MDGGAGPDNIPIAAFDRMRAPHSYLQPTEPAFGVTDGLATPITMYRGLDPANIPGKNGAISLGTLGAAPLFGLSFTSTSVPREE